MSPVTDARHFGVHSREFRTMTTQGTMSTHRTMSTQGTTSTHRTTRTGRVATTRRTGGRRAAVAGAAVAGVAVAVAVLSACGSAARDGHDGHTPATRTGPSATAPASPGSHNTDDVSFAQGMIAHHRQAVQMAELAATRTASPEVRDLAVEIQQAQSPEIRTLTGWLAAWGEPVTGAGGSAEHGGHAPGGMMTGQELEKLEKSSGAAFDRAFLTLMVEHHEGAVEMARNEIEHGAHRPARDLARDVVTAQSEEITRMNELLGRP
ncbi:DUF305 domain-containing protein [Streptomyces sp. NPDC052023]|uniref:DUF305 domain-containing protein n=1 Tax=Streptomyces sp. NPDC052023 TaxID=3365681 RepID=UPI0037CDBDBB